MIERITLFLATPIVKAILDKFYEGFSSKLGEQAVEKLPEKVKQLGQVIWEKCLKGKPETDELLQKAASGSEEEQRKLKECLNQELERNLLLKQEIQQLAEKIRLEIDGHCGEMNQNNYSGTNFQNKVDGGIVNQASSITQNYYNVH